MTKVRSLFVSDLHLGFRHARAGQFLDMLRAWPAENLYLVGDLLDGWRLARHWYWPTVYDEVVDHVLKLAASGVRVYYTPGNHDEFLRGPHPAIDGIVVADELIHTTADGRRLLVTHGDLFDSVEKRFHFISQVGSRAYDVLMAINQETNRLLSVAGVPELNYCFAIKRWSKSIVGSAAKIPNAAARAARDQGCQGVIFGHLHRPSMNISDGFAVCNTGDWVENQSLIVEHRDGRLELVNRGKRIHELLPSNQ